MPSSSSSLLSSASPSFPLLDRPLLERDCRADVFTDVFSDDARMCGSLASPLFLTETKEEEDAMEWIRVRLCYSFRNSRREKREISRCGQI